MVTGKEYKIGWIGTGVMGTPMFEHILDSGFKGYVYNRTKSKALPLIEKGAEWKDSPDLIAVSADIIFTIVGYPEDVKDVYYGKRGLFSGAGEGKIFVDMTTTSPSLAIEIYNTACNKGMSSIDAPVSGGDVGARNAELSIMAGGDREVFDKILPLLKILGKRIVYQGNAGAGQHTKMANQIVIASTMIGVCESLLYSYRAGLDPLIMLQSVSGGAAACWTLDNLAPRIIRGDFEPGFYVNHFIKDMCIALEESEKMNITLPGLKLVHKLYLMLKDKDYGLKGTQALFIAIQKLSGENENPDLCKSQIRVSDT